MSLIVPLRGAPAAELPEKAGPVGPGAGVLMTEYNLGISGALRRSVQDQMRDAAKLGIEVSWIRAAERAICGPGASVEWHLEDPEGDTIGEDYPNATAVEAFHLVETPQQFAEVVPKSNRRAFWYRTLHHMGVCGPAFWYKDQADPYGIPRDYLYIRPDRMTPLPDKEGNLSGWILDGDSGRRSDATKLRVEDVVQFDLEPPDEGFMSWGLVKSAMTKITLTTGLDKHVASVLASGGRLSGIIAPKVGTIDDDNVFQQILRDWRNIAEQPEAAKRAQVVRYPVDFIKTASDLRDLEIVKLLADSRDELLELWGVPLSQIGGNPPAGLNSGGVRESDRQALWENAIHPRLAAFGEVLQSQMDLWKPLLGFCPKVVISEPEFTNDSPRFDLLAKSQTLPMRNRERRDLIGLDPFGPKVIGPSGQPADDEVWLPSTAGLALAFAAPEEGIPDQPYMIIGGSEAQLQREAPTAAKPVAPTAVPSATPPPAEKPGAAKADLPQADLIRAVEADLSHQYPDEMLRWIPLLTWAYDEGVKVKKMEPTRPDLKPAVVKNIVTALKVGAPMDPFVLVDFPNSDELVIANGNHRRAAAEQEDIRKVPAYVGTASLGNEKAVRAAIAEMQSPETAPAKATLTPLRRSVAAELEPRMREAARTMLDGQKRDIVARVRAHPEHVTGPRHADTSPWWDGPKWDGAFMRAMHPVYQAILRKVRSGIRAGKAMPLSLGPLTPTSPALLARILERGAGRVTMINETTRDGIRELIAGGVADGLSGAQVGDAIEAWSGWDEYRAERIATTELAQSYNTAVIGSYGEMGVEKFQAVDECTCDLCQEQFGDSPIFSADEAEGIEDHPNGTLDWEPVIDEEAALGDLEDS